MKKFLLTLSIFVSVLAHSQTFNNEWIDYNKTYYKFKVWVTGLYRINQPALSAMGLGAIPAEQFQLWRNGEQVPLYTTVQTGVLGAGDYIEFWGEMADGKPDRALYRDVNSQLNDKWNGQTDTAAFFLTVNPAGANLRYAPTANNLGGPLPTPEPFFMHNEQTYYEEIFNQGVGANVGSTIYSSAYDIGEGRTSNNIATGATRTVNLTNLHVYTGAGAPDGTFRINAAGNTLTPRQVEVRINGTLVLNQTMDFFDYVKASAPVPIADISTSTASIAIKNASTVTGDRMIMGKHELIYPRVFNFGNARNFIFELPSSATSKYLEIANFNHGGTPPVLYDITNGKRYVVNIDNPALIKVLLEPSAANRKLILVSEEASNITAITTAQQRNFLNLSLAANQGNYLIISHPVLKNGTGGTTPLEDYRLYRNSAAGGGFNTKVYMIDELIDQFGYGITQTPLGIRNFLMWARRNFTTGEIKNVLLIGKAVLYYQYRNNRANADINKLALVPTFGAPGSDIKLSCEPGNDIPITPIGRLSVVKADEVTVYLNKVKQYEAALAVSSPAIASQAWKKNIVHIVGASDAGLQRSLDINMTNYKSIVLDTFYGANVHTFSKTSTDPVEESNSVRLQGLFSDGIGMLTYFGHSSATTLEYNLDDPQRYNNAGKYPLFVFLGCNAGNFFNFNLARLQTNETISEKYVLANERGGIASLASSSLGIVHYLDIYNSRTYEAMSRTRYGSSLGEIMKETITQTFNFTGQSDFYARMQCEQTTLHGDPALKMHAYPKADYVIEDPQLKISPSFVSVAESFFKVDATFLNIGRAVNKEIVIEIKRTYPNNITEVIHRDTIEGIRFSDSLSYNIPIVATRDKGLNKITITADADNEVDELYESNNSITKDVFIFEDEARPVYPYNFAIVNQQNIKLYASTANPFVASRQYNMEMDTTELFNSPLKITRSVNSVGGVLEFTPGITFQDSTVYYWRVGAVPTSGSPLWNTSSFIYLANSDLGFSQAHYYQHVKSDKNKILLNAQARDWHFDSSGHFIFAKNGVFLTATNQEGDLIVSPDGIPFIRSACIGYSLIFNIFNPLTFQPNVNLNGRYGTPLPCTPTRNWNYEFSYMTTASRKLARDFMDSIPNGYIVVVRNIMNPGQVGGYINEWIADEPTLGVGNTLYHKLKDVGFNMLDSFYKARAFIHMYVKGNNGFTPTSVVSVNEWDLVSMTGDFMTPDTVGYITSPAFGRAKAWKQLQWRGTSAPDLTPGDAPKVDIIGVGNSGNESLLLSGMDISQQTTDISSIDAATYPYLKIRMRNADSVNFTAYQLKFWKLTYDPVPEGAIAPNIYLKVKDTVDVGEPMDFKIAFKNVTNIPFDSMRVKMVVTDRNNLEHIIPIPKSRKLLASDTLQIGTLINTTNFPGPNTVFLEANPDNDQPEQHHFNNFAFRSLYVRPDSLNPLMDVTFDGLHILNRDIVSSKPDIVIKLKDEAKWMVLNDTSLLTLSVRYPGGAIRRFYFNNDTLRFTPAGQAPTTDNTALINFAPYFTEDGEYELIVSGKDRSENAAGAIEYRVIFEVINKPMISNMLNYPNPFTTSTAFVFTITGSEVPQNIKIEIMTVTGKIVREITKDELGPLYIGRNITEFKWDGTDQYGQKLANGIYLYRVVTNLNGKALDKYKSQKDNTDKYFNKGYGKMYLMR